MKPHSLIILSLLLIQISLPTLALSDSEIKERIIKESIANYKRNVGNCPCDYSLNIKKHKCGKTSAWSKPGGESPICYPNDVTKKMIKEYRQSNKNL